MTIGGMPRVRRLRARALGTSAIALAASWAGTTQAQCAPEPTVASGTTTCTGTDPNGLTVSTYGTRVVVPQGATVQGAPAIGIRITSGDQSGSPVAVEVAGRVDGGTTGAGVSLVSQAPANGFAFEQVLNLSVATGGVVRGTTGVALQGNSTIPYPRASIDNRGTIASSVSGGLALSATGTAAEFTSIINREGATMGAISGQVRSFTNAGTVDGGTRSALDGLTGFISTFANTGTITSAGAAATLANVSAFSLTNNGTIANTGTGVAMEASSLSLTNAAGARISAAGGTALRTGGTVTLTNAGTIDGAVVSTIAPSFVGGFVGGSFVDSTAGRINGSLTLGAGDDTLVGLWRNGQVATGITGAINGGGGSDLLRVRFDADATVSAPVALPTSFERLGLSVAQDRTATLAGSFANPGTLAISGSGTVVNRVALTAAGRVVTIGGFSFQAPNETSNAAFTNAGTITATAAGSPGNVGSVFAVTLDSGARRFDNSGTIVSAAGGVTLSSSGLFANTGIVAATDIGLSMFNGSATSAAGAVIRSTGGTAVVMSGNVGGPGLTNAGLVEGAVAGVRVSGVTLTNSGVVRGNQAGVLLDFYGRVNNRAGGVIDGAVTAQTGNSFAFQNIVANAGTINGNVILGDARNTNTNSNSYFALAGGVLNGNLSLGQGDTLIAELAGTANGRFAGITGAVSANNATLRLRVRGPLTTSTNVVPGFATVGYDLFDDAALTLTGAGTPIQLAGRGSADVTADLSSTTQSLLSTTNVLLAPGETPVQNALAVTSRGTLTLTRANTNSFVQGAVVVGAGDSFTNAGSIVATDRAGDGFTPIAAVAGGTFFNGPGGAQVTNTGTITLDGATGVFGAGRVTNTGSIVQAAGAARASVGLSASSFLLTLANSGTIDVGGIAVQALSGTGTAVDNSGRIASTGTAAVRTTGAGSSVANAATGTIVGTGGTAVQMSGGTVTNAGSITGSVNLGYSTFGQSSSAGTYVADGGTITGDLLFGSGADTLVSFGPLGVTGRVDGGAGLDTFVQARRTSGDVTLALPAGITGFERLGARALGADTVVTLRADGPAAGQVAVSGDGGIVNAAQLTGAVRVVSITPQTFGVQPETLGSFTNQSVIRGGFDGAVRSFTNAEGGVLGSERFAGQTVRIDATAPVAFDNRGSILNNGTSPAVALSTRSGLLSAANAGTITGQVNAFSFDYSRPDEAPPVPRTVSFVNTGSITADIRGESALNLSADARADETATATLVNSGLIEATGRSGVGATLTVSGGDEEGRTRSISVSNAGTIRANGGGFVAAPGFGYRYTDPAGALLLSSNADGAAVTVATVTNTGTLEATGERSSVIGTYDVALDLTNSGTIRGTAGTVLESDDGLAEELGGGFLAGAIQAGADAADRILNTGTIIGSVDLGRGDDRFENRGRMDGDVFLGAGSDIFVQLASATLTGTVDAGEGDDLFVVDATGGGAVNGDQFVNFERFNQVGEGQVAYSGRFRFDTIALAGGTLTVAPGQTLSTDGPTTITGTDAAETVENDGTITGNVSLLGGNDQVANRGTIGGSVFLGDSDDVFVEGAGSSVAGTVDGGAGTDLYAVVLAGDRTGIGARTGFERLGVEGTGTLTLALDQGFDRIGLSGTGLTLALNGFRVGQVTGSDAAERLSVDGDVAQVALGAGDDRLELGRLELGGATAAGSYDGGAGSDLLRFAATGPVTLSGNATGFERVELAGGSLTVAGSLGSAGAPLSFGDGAQSLVVARGGTLAGAIDLGAGDDSLRLAAGSVLSGTVSGGAGTDTAVLELAGDRTLSSATLTGFERLGSEGTGTLTLTGAQTYAQVDAATNLAVASGSSLAASVRFGAGDQRFTIAGGFAGSVDGGAGTDTIAVSGGTETAPIAFSTVQNVEAFAMAGGFATVSGNAGLGNVDLSAGRLVGLSGSTLSAAQFLVRARATFGSAGTVNGNLQVAGILSPGASPGTMTVNGNVALAAGSVSLFELTPTVSDRLVVNGALAIAPGATLRLVTTGAITPGTSFDLISASAGITGSYSTVERPASLFGALVQDATRIRLLGQFLGVQGATPQVARSIAYANAVIASGRAPAAFLAAVPSLLTASGASNAAAFARLTPEPYATATQAGVDDALALVGAARGPAFAPVGEDPGLFVFGQGVANWHRLGADGAEGTSAAASRGWGLMGGVGYGARDWSVGVFAGRLDTTQSIGALGASTSSDGFVAGAHARWAPSAFQLTASVLYDGGDADTRRALPGGTARGGYDLTSWVSDLSASYALDMGTEWTLRPRVGVTWLRTSRGAVAEAGGPFALSVARDRHRAGFADLGLGVGRTEESAADFRPYASLGVRYQIEGRRTEALASYAGGPLGLVAVGASRARAVATAAAGLSMRVADALDLFSTASVQTGRDDHQEAISTGLRFRF